MEFQIKVRQTEDWFNLTESCFFENYKSKFEYGSNFGNDKTPEKHFNNFKENVILWNKRYTPNFFQYRHQIKKIALDNWNDTKIYVNYDNNIIKDVVYLPTDDDDWFKPDIKKELEQIFEKYDINLVVWNGLCLNNNSIKKYKKISSNGYAFRNIFDKKILKYHCFPELYLNEIFTSKINEELSVWIRHSASWCILSQNFNIQTKFNINYPNWSIPYVEKLNSICVSRKEIKL